LFATLGQLLIDLWDAVRTQLHILVYGFASDLELGMTFGSGFLLELLPEVV
jgi:hypothetical protein